MVGRDFIHREIENLGRSGGVHVEVVAECPEKPLVAGQVRHDAQFDLRIVGGQQHVAIRRHECLANLAALGRADRDVLQVRIGRRQAPGGGNRLVIGGMDAPGGR